MIPLILAGAAVVGGVVSAVGTVEQGQEAKRAAEANARLQRLAANDAIRRGAIQAGRVRMQGSQVVAQQRAIIGTSGVDTSSGSAAALSESTRALAEMDVETIKNNAFREAWGLRTGADQMQRQGEMAARSANWSAAGGILGSAASAGGTLYKSGYFGAPTGGA